MADYTSKYYGAEIDSAVGTALALKDLRGIIKITADGPVAAVANEDYIADSSSIVNVAGILKGVADAKTGKIVVHKAEADIDYQTPLKAGIDYATPTAVANKQNKITAQGLLKGLGDGSVAQATPGEDYQLPIPAGTYATPDDAKAFAVTFTENTGDLTGTYTSDKTLAEIVAAYNANKNIIGRFASNNNYVMRLVYVQNESFIEMGYLYSDGIVILDSFSSNLWSVNTYDFVRPSDISEVLPESGYSLHENTIYNVSSPVGTYVFTPPASGWAHGTFSTAASVAVSFVSGANYLGAAPAIEANKTYEFDVYNGVWAVQEVVSA